MGWFGGDSFDHSAQARRVSAQRRLCGRRLQPGFSDTARAFATKYEAAYKAVPDFGAAFSYDAVRVLARAMAEAKSLEPEKLREAILSTKGYDGAEGVYNFDQNGDGLHGYNIVRIDNGAPVFLKHIDFND